MSTLYALWHYSKHDSYLILMYEEGEGCVMLWSHNNYALLPLQAPPYRVTLSRVRKNALDLKPVVCCQIFTDELKKNFHNLKISRWIKGWFLSAGPEVFTIDILLFNMLTTNNPEHIITNNQNLQLLHLLVVGWCCTAYEKQTWQPRSYCAVRIKLFSSYEKKKAAGKLQINLYIILWPYSILSYCYSFSVSVL